MILGEVNASPEHSFWFMPSLSSWTSFCTEKVINCWEKTSILMQSTFTCAMKLTSKLFTVGEYCKPLTDALCVWGLTSTIMYVATNLPTMNSQYQLKNAYPKSIEEASLLQAIKECSATRDLWNTASTDRAISLQFTHQFIVDFPHRRIFIDRRESFSDQVHSLITGLVSFTLRSLTAVHEVELPLGKLSKKRYFKILLNLYWKGDITVWNVTTTCRKELGYLRNIYWSVNMIEEQAIQSFEHYKASREGKHNAKIVNDDWNKFGKTPYCKKHNKAKECSTKS